MIAFAQHDRGQTLVVIAIAAALIMAALAFGVDWGYAMVQRRNAQNIADASAIGAGKFLATSVINTSQGNKFSASQEETWCAAKGYDQPWDPSSGRVGNRSYTLPGASLQLDLYYGNAGTPTVWTTSGQPTSAPPCPTSGGTEVPFSTIYVRVVATLTVPALFASVAGRSSYVASASARVRLSGTSMPLNGGPLWSMIRHYDASDFVISCGSPCDPTTVKPVTFWSSGGGGTKNEKYGNWKGLINYSRYSPNFSSINQTTVPQLITQWDQSGHPPINSFAVDQTGKCKLWGNGNWDTAGQSDDNNDAQCSIPNWVYYGFRGQLSLSSTWSSAVQGQSPSVLPISRSVCSSPPNPAPSCTADVSGGTTSSLGDWVETDPSGDLGNNLAGIMTTAINNLGQNMPFSATINSKTGQPYGKALVVIVYLWDCAESFSASTPHWSLIYPNGGTSGDCSRIQDTGGLPTPKRVHLFTAAPFTFYAGLVSGSQIQGFWGGVFGDPNSCTDPDNPSGCSVLNTFSNTAVLVPDN